MQKEEKKMNKKPLIECNFAQIYANSQPALWQTQQEYESSVKAYIHARDNHTDSVLAYEKEFGNEVKKLRGKEQATILKEIAKSNCFDYYENMLKSEQIKKKAGALKKAFEERINTIKKLMDTNINKIN
jgi:hypothetical protein